jgi:hypothetical protein
MANRVTTFVVWVASKLRRREGADGNEVEAPKEEVPSVRSRLTRNFAMLYAHNTTLSAIIVLQAFTILTLAKLLDSI